MNATKHLSKTHIYTGKKMTQYVLSVTEWLNFSGILDFFRDLKRSYEHNKKVRQTIKELSKLNDRELRDIGISRGDIWAVANYDEDYKVSEPNKNLKGWV